MTYAKIEQKHTDDERWIDAGADAFAVHVAAVVYCDRQLTDGRISAAMARRVSLAVPPARTSKAIAALVEQGFWKPTETGYQIADFHEHAFPAEQVKTTRQRWADDKNRRRQHANGDHSLCKDPKFCPAIRDHSSTVESTEDSAVESAAESTGGGSHLYQTQPNQTEPNPTRPDRREGSGQGKGKGAGGSASSGGSAPLAASSAPPPGGPAWAGGLPPGVIPTVNGVPAWTPDSDPRKSQS